MTEFPAQLEALGLRPLRTADAPELHALIEANRGYLSRWVPWATEQEMAGTEKFIAETQDQLARNDGFQVCLAPDGPIVGMVGFHSVSWGNRNTTIGYWLAEGHQGRGLMTTAVRALVDYAFDDWKLHRIEIHCAPANHRSRAIPERLGFRKEATLRETELVGGRYSTASSTAPWPTSGLGPSAPVKQLSQRNLDLSAAARLVWYLLVSQRNFGGSQWPRNVPGAAKASPTIPWSKPWPRIPASLRSERRNCSAFQGPRPIRNRRACGSTPT